MKTIGRVIASAGLAVVLTLGVAVASEIGAGPGPEREVPVVTPPSGALLGPAPSSFEFSIATLQERLRARPNDREALAALGLAYLAKARATGDPSWYAPAEQALGASIAASVDGNVDALLGMGALALARHDFERALAFGRRVLDLAPSSADAYGIVGDALVELGRYEPAFDAFQTMVDMRPGLASYARVSYARELLGDVDGARDAMELAFGAAGTPSDRAWTAYHLGEIAFGSGHVEEAARWFGRGHHLDPAYIPNLAGLARVAWARGEIDLAIARYEEVVARSPSAEFVIALGDLYRSIGRHDLAAEQDEVVRAMHELARANGVNVDLELALFDADHGGPVSALAAARAEWRRRRSVHVADALGWALYANGRYEEAARYAERALALGTRSALFWFHAGMIRLELGEVAAGRSALRRALAIDPHFSILHARTAERVLERVRTSR